MKIVVSLSGGLDSMVLAAWLVATGHEVRAVAVDYAQRHRVEVEYAARIAEVLGVHFTRVDVPGIGAMLNASNCSQVNPKVSVPRGHYQADSMRRTVVPNRNAILLMIAAAHAIQVKANAVAIANHAGDHAIYPDCRPEFVEAAQALLKVCHYEPVGLIAPFTTLTKAEIVKLGASLPTEHVAPFHLAFSCYEGQDGNGHAIHCGRCGTCVERSEAFNLAGVADPTTYAHLAAMGSQGRRSITRLTEFKQPARIPV